MNEQGKGNGEHGVSNVPVCRGRRVACLSSSILQCSVAVWMTPRVGNFCKLRSDLKAIWQYGYPTASAETVAMFM